MLQQISADSSCAREWVEPLGCSQMISSARPPPRCFALSPHAVRHASRAPYSRGEPQVHRPPYKLEQPLHTPACAGGLPLSTRSSFSLCGCS